MNILLMLGVYVTTEINSFIHFLMKLPIIGKLIPEKIYSKYTLKKTCSVLGVIYDLVVKAITQNVLLLALVCFIPKVFISPERMGKNVYAFLFVMIFVVYSFVAGSTLFKGSAEDQMFIHYFMVNPSHYYKFKAYKSLVLGSLVMIPGLIYLFRSFAMVLGLILLRCAMVLVTNVFYLVMFKKVHKIPHVRIRKWSGIVIMVSAFLCAALNFIPKKLPSNSTMYIISCICTLIIILSFVYIGLYDKYNDMAIKYAEKGLVKFAITSGTSFNEGDNVLLDGGSEKNEEFFKANKSKSATEYVDYAFRQRYKKAIREPIISDGIMYGIIIALIGVAVRTGWIAFNADDLMSYSPIVVSITLMMSLADGYIKRYFRNVDLIYMRQHMLTPEFVKTTMIQRYVKALLMDVWIVVAIAVDLVCFVLASGIKVGVSDILWLVAISASVLVIHDTYEWFIYYMIQPYSAELTVKSPVFTVLGYVDSLLMLLFLFIRTNIVAHFGIVLAITLAVIAVYLISSKWAYKTFKLRF